MKTAKRQSLLANVQTLRAIAAVLVVFVHMTLKNVGVEDVLPRNEAAWLTPFGSIGIFGVDLFCFSAASKSRAPTPTFRSIASGSSVFPPR